MFERATDDVIALAAAAATAVVGVIAVGVAIFAGSMQVFHVTVAVAALIVAVVAAITMFLFALFANVRARAKERLAAEAQAELSRQLPANILDLARDHPIAAILTTLVGGAVAARHPKLIRDVIALVARFSGTGR